MLVDKQITNEVITDIKQFGKYHPDLVNPVNEELMSKYYGNDFE